MLWKNEFKFWSQKIWTAKTRALKERKCVSDKVLCLLCFSTQWQELSSLCDINTALKTTALYTDSKVLASEYFECPKSSVWFKSQQWNTIFPRGHVFITPTTYHNWLQGSGLSREDVTGIKAAFPAFKSAAPILLVQAFKPAFTRICLHKSRSDDFICFKDNIGLPTSYWKQYKDCTSD